MPGRPASTISRRSKAPSLPPPRHSRPHQRLSSSSAAGSLCALHASLPRSPSSRRAGRPWPRSNPRRITPPAERLTRRCASLPPVAAPNCSKAAAGAPTYPLQPCNKPPGRLSQVTKPGTRSPHAVRLPRHPVGSQASRCILVQKKYYRNHRCYLSSHIKVYMRGNHYFGKGKRAKEKHVDDVHLYGLSFVSDYAQYHCPHSSNENTRCYLFYVFYQYVLNFFENNYTGLQHFYTGQLFMTKSVIIPWICGALASLYTDDHPCCAD